MQKIDLFFFFHSPLIIIRFGYKSFLIFSRKIVYSKSWATWTQMKKTYFTLRVQTVAACDLLVWSLEIYKFEFF